MADEKKKETQRLTNQDDVVLLIPPEDQPTEVHKRGGAEGSFSFTKTDATAAPSSGGDPSTNANLPPKVPEESSLLRRRSIARSPYSKSKSRLLEPVASISQKVVEEIDRLNFKSPGRNSPSAAAAASPNVKPATPKSSLPVTPRTPLIGAGQDEDADDEVYKNLSLEEGKKSGKRFKLRLTVELVAFVCIMTVLVTSLTVDRMKAVEIWSLKLWRWSILILTVFCGRLFSEWFINVLVFLIERNFMLRKKVLYFVFGVRRSVQFFIWFALILLAWALLINRGVERSENAKEILHYVTRTIVSFLIWSAIWMFKTFMVKLLASNFHVTRFFDRIQESIFHQYVLQTLSGPPLMEMEENVVGKSKGSGRLSVSRSKIGKEANQKEVINVEKLHKIKQEKVSAWTMRGLVKVIRSSGLSTLTDALDDSGDDEGGEQKDKEITSEVEAKAAAYRIFRNVAKPNSKQIDEEDLLRFLKKEELKDVLPLFEGAAETGKIKKLVLRNWVVSVYNERKALAHSLNDTKTAIEELNRLLSAVVVVVGLIVWLIVMGFLTTQVLVLISSQLLLIVFMFGNSAKTAFEAIIFVFVMHPFDVGDRCVVDGVTLTVEEMNILTTVFLRYDNEKIIYPNSVLATKPISNWYRSPEMSDSVEFAIDVSTPFETIDALKAKIKEYLESKPLHWRPSHAVQVKEIEQVNKMKMALYVNHTVNFQSPERGDRRSDLMLQLKRIFEQLQIKYHLLPQEVRLSYIGSAPPPSQQQNVTE